jgi:hypothetical protein
MKNVVKRFLREENGDALILAALALVFLLGMAGLALDGGMIYMKKSELQKVANAAVLSGAQELPNKQENVEQVVEDILNVHHELASKSDLQIAMADNPDKLPPRVGIDLSKSVKLTFLPLLGINKATVTAHAAAGLAPMGRAEGVAPLGIDESVTLNYYQTYQLKVDSSGVQTGNFGILALGGPGARTYADNLRYGYQEEVKFGDIINTQTGNIAGDTRDAIQERVNACSFTPGDYTERFCPRILLIPVYTPYQSDTNQVKSVKITGFAYFYITDPMSSTDTSIKGMFIKRTGTGFFEEGSLDKGAYSIRLTE